MTPNDADQADLKPGKPVKVDDPAKLTDDEKGQVSAGIKTANPTAPINSIKVNDDGSADVTFNDGSTKTVPSNVVQTDKGKYTVAAGKPVTLTHGQKVKAGDSLDSSAVTLTDAKGQTVSLPDGAKVVWTEAPDTSEVGNDKAGQVKVVYGDQTESEPVKVTYNVTPNDAEQYTPTVKDKTKVDDPKKLTDDEKKEVADNIRDNNPGLPEGTKIDVGDNGDTTITYPDTSVDTIPGDQLVQGQKGDTSDAGNITPTIPGGKVTVKDPSHLTDDEKNQVKNKVEEANKGKFPDGTKVTVGDDGTTTVTYPDGSKDTIPGKDLIIGVKGEGISGNNAEGMNGNNAEGMNGNTAKSGSKNNSLKTLPQTGTKDVTILEILGLFLSLFGLLGLKKKHREE